MNSSKGYSFIYKLYIAVQYFVFFLFFVQIQRYNILLDEIRKSLSDLEKGIQGLVVMTLVLENIFVCIFDGRVPPAWEKVKDSILIDTFLLS